MSSWSTRATIRSSRATRAKVIYATACTANGATTSQIRRLVLFQGAVPVAVGLLTGVILALWATRLAAKFRFGVTPADPLTFTAVTLLLGRLALAASYLPARRASLRQPVVALRQE